MLHINVLIKGQMISTLTASQRMIVLIKIAVWEPKWHSIEPRSPCLTILVYLWDGVTLEKMSHTEQQAISVQ